MSYTLRYSRFGVEVLLSRMRRGRDHCPQEEKANHFCDNPAGDKGGEGFRCTSGLCVQKALACNGKMECEDGSDESIGCELFPEESCPSWFGEKHVRCTEFNNTLDSQVRTISRTVTSSAVLTIAVIGC